MLNFDPWLTTYTLSGFALVIILSFIFLKRILAGELSEKQSVWIWGVIFVLLLIFMRYPFIAYNYELDIDESQMLAQAFSLKKYWVYWKYVDGLTQGPLASYFLIIPSWFGMPFDYTSARIVGLIVLLVTLLATYGTLRNLFGPPISLIVFAPVAYFYLLSQGVFSTLYNDYVALLLLSVCFWLFSILYTQKKPDTRTLFLIGLVAGLVPFGKLQGVPTALIIALFSAVIVLQRSDKIFRHFSFLVLGGITFPAIIVSLAIHYDAFDYFWNFYIVSNMEYTSGTTLLQKALNFPNFLRLALQFAYLLFSFLILSVVGSWLLLRFRLVGKTINLLFAFGLVQVAVAFYAVIKSGYLFPHYLQFMIIPLAIFSCALLEISWERIQWNYQKTRMAAAFWLVFCILPHLLYKLTTVGGFTSVGYKRMTKEELGKPLQISAIAHEILKYTRPGEDLAVWGWNPAYHIETELAQGTGDNEIYRVLTPAPRRQEHLDKYIDDLNRSKPPVFVDQITDHSNWFNDPDRYKHERIAQLRDFVARNYQLVSTIDQERIYVRKDRLSLVSGVHGPAR